MLRTCNVLRIAGLPALRKDGARRRDGEGGGFETRPYVFARNQRPNPRLQPNVQTHVSDI
ncbi:MAG: hypothetical protein LBM98_03580 [Oscillospiraceae bacterium]|nr:hypothetical protein [Oscillospiraceae bacterium]